MGGSAVAVATRSDVVTDVGVPVPPFGLTTAPRRFRWIMLTPTSSRWSYCGANGSSVRGVCPTPNAGNCSRARSSPYLSGSKFNVMSRASCSRKLFTDITLVSRMAMT